MMDQLKLFNVLPVAAEISSIIAVLNPWVVTPPTSLYIQKYLSYDS